VKWSRQHSANEFKVTSFRKECVSHEPKNRHGVAKDHRDHETAAHCDHRSDVQVKQVGVFHF